jgi:hypothetical protein
MNQQNCNFYEDRNWIGEFTIAGDHRKVKVSGELIYKKNQIPYLEIVTLDESFLIPFAKPNTFQVKIGHINGYVKNQKSDEEKLLYVTLTNCISSSISVIAARKFIVYFDYAFFSEERFFTDSDELLSVEYFFNNWDEFNYAQGWKSEARYKRHKDIFSLENNIHIKFCQSISGNYLFNEDKIFNRLFFDGDGEISEEEIGQINDGLKNILSKYIDKIFIKNSESHRWFLSLSGGLSINNIPRITYYLTTLLTCLTHDFETSLEGIEIFSKSSKSKHATRFMLLYEQPTIKTQKFSYNQHDSCFKKTSFSNQEWEIILNSLFCKTLNQEDLLDNFFFVLQENHLDTFTTPFCITRAIDCLDGIASNKSYKNSEKYQKVILWFLDGLEQATQDLALQFIDEKLDYIVIEKDSKNVENIRGMKVSQLRAISVHFGNTSGNQMDLQKAHHLLYVFELMLIDFVFEKLCVPKKQRNDYKKFYLEKVPWF